MKYSTFSAILMISLCFLAPMRAEEKYDPAARAKAVAPFINASTFAVVHVDVSRVNSDALFDVARRLSLFDEEEAKSKQMFLKQGVDLFLKTGCKEIYVVVNHFDLDLHHPIIVVPLPAGADEKTLATLLPMKKREGVIVFDGFDLSKPVPEIAPDARPDLVAAFEAAGDTALQVIFTPPKHFKRTIEEIMPKLPQEIGGGEGTLITHGCLWAALGIDLPPQPAFQLVVQSQDAVSADALKAKWIELLKLGSQWNKISESIRNCLALSQSLTPDSKDGRLVLSLDNSEGKIDKMLEDVRVIHESKHAAEAAGRSHDNLMQIGGAMFKYYEANEHFPPAIYSKDGKPLLSWRVAILPYLGLNNLYEEFHLDEPWDSPHNIKLSAIAVAVYLPTNSKSNMTPDKKSFITQYVVPVGPGTVFEGKEGMSKKEINGGRTILALEVDEDGAVIWTKPDDLPYDPQTPNKGLSKKYGFYALYVNGRVEPVQSSTAADELRALFSASGRRQ
jgi:hypothetical protein